MRRNRDVSARAAISAFLALEHVIGTPAEPLAWRHYTDTVARLRRSYVAFVVQQGLLTGAVAGLGAAIASSLWRNNNLLLVVIVLGAAFVFVGGWARMIVNTVAPLRRHGRHVWPLWVFVVLYESGVLSGFAVPSSVPWSVAVGAAVTAPWLTAGLLEWRQPLPSAAPQDVAYT